VEFAFVKECLGRDAPKIDTSVWTANQLLVLTSVAVAILAATIFIVYKKGGFSKKKNFRTVHHLRDDDTQS